MAGSACDTVAISEQRGGGAGGEEELADPEASKALQAATFGSESLPAPRDPVPNRPSLSFLDQRMTLDGADHKRHIVS